MSRLFQNLLFLLLAAGLFVAVFAERAPASGPVVAGGVAPVGLAQDSDCITCHEQETPGIVSHWRDSTHADLDVKCIDCHSAEEGDADAWVHEGALIATIVTPRDCAECHEWETEEFLASHHSKAGRILHSLDNRLAEVTEGNRVPYNPHGITPGREDFGMVNGLASAQSGCMQCHGSKVSFEGKDGNPVSVDELMPDEDGRPTNAEAVANILRGEDGRPVFVSGTWPNTGIGRKNFDGTEGSCSACHSRHDFSPRRARQPENCAKCHLGPDHPQKEVFEESKHGIAYRDLKDKMNLDADEWVLGVDYNAAPTCATCHMSGNRNNGGEVTHDPGIRISWTNRPPVSLVMDTIDGSLVKEADPEKRAALIAAAGDSFDSWEAKRDRMKQVCANCHSGSYVDGFYEQYDDFIDNYNQKFAVPGGEIMRALRDNDIRTEAQFDEEIEWTWFYLWHHEGRRGRHGASMMAPDYAHWHGMYEVAERFYMELIPQAREMAAHAAEHGNQAGADKVNAVIDAILARPEHDWSNVEANRDRDAQKFEFDK